MNRLARASLVALTLAAGSVAHVASAQSIPAGSVTPRPVAAPAGQGIAVLAMGTNANEEAFALARAIYASRLRPTALDEVRARVLAGGAPPANASRELRDLAEIRAGVGADDAAGRRLLTGIAQQVGADALLVVRVEDAPATVPTAPSTMGTSTSDAGVADGGADPASATGNAAAASIVVARLFIVDPASPPGDFDAARYYPDPAPPAPRSPAAWKSTVTSLEGRFPAAARNPGPSAALAPAPAAPLPDSGTGKSTHFYTSAWFWGAVGGAALLGTAFYFATRDTTSSTIHLQMQVPK